jgi:molybdopterin converting factor small subunit
LPVTIEVLFFAQLKEAVGSARRSVEVADGTTVDGVVAAISAWPEWEPVSALPLSYAVNERLVGGEHRLHDGDTLALLTPISGG